MKKILHLLLFAISFSACTQTVDDETVRTVIKNTYDFNINDHLHTKESIKRLKPYVDKADSLKLKALDKSITDTEIMNRLVVVFKNNFTAGELNQMAKDWKLADVLLSEKMQGKIISEKKGTNSYSVVRDGKSATMDDEVKKAFEDIDSQLELIEKNIRYRRPSVPPFIPIAVDKPDGFYIVSGKNEKHIVLSDTPSIGIDEVTHAQIDFSNIGDIEIRADFSPAGASKFQKITGANIGKKLAIVVDKKIISMPIINGIVVGGRGTITGNFSKEEADNMVKKLRRK